jgi:hypothetical protein
MKGRIMKKAMMIKKLEIAKETLRRLDNKELLQAAVGGAWSDDSVCPTVNPSNRICP